MSDSKTYSIIHQIEIYPVDSIIWSFNNQGLEIFQDFDNLQHSSLGP